jgi:hypothetical protein
MSRGRVHPPQDLASLIKIGNRGLPSLDNWRHGTLHDGGRVGVGAPRGNRENKDV